MQNLLFNSQLGQSFVKKSLSSFFLLLILLECFLIRFIVILHFNISHNAPRLPPTPPPPPPPPRHPKKKQICTVFSFSWDNCNTQEKWKTKVMQKFGGGGGEEGGVSWKRCKWRIGHFWVYKNPHFKNEAKWKTLLVKISFTCMRILRSFSNQWLRTYPRFETEVWDNYIFIS